MNEHFIRMAYLVASVLFILGLKGLAHPRTAVRGNFIGAVGMLLAIVVTLLDKEIVGYGVIAAGLVIGSVIGATLATWVKMTAMPQMVALLNGFGGIASVLVAGADQFSMHEPGVALGLAVGLTGLIGAVTFTGSLVAFAKLEEFKFLDKIEIPGGHQGTILVSVGCLLLMIWLIASPASIPAYVVLSLLAFGLGVQLTMPIGAADMPVAIALLNSYSGLAAAATGFVIGNGVLIVAGSLVGASGVILTQIMCKAMNRSMLNIVFGVGTVTSAKQRKADDVYGGRIKSTSAEEIAMLFDAAQRVVIVPGYGLAVSQAQHAVRDLTRALEAKGITVEFGIHPVAGRMPGHMNVLLAEAEIPYEKLLEMDLINPTFPQTDVSLVIGANDVVNPMARTDPQCPIAGMPILDVDKSRTVVVIKRSLSPGFAGIPNPLFAAENTLMYFADGKQALQEIIAAVKQS